MPVLKARIGGTWVDVGGAGVSEVAIGPNDPGDSTTELWYDTDEPNLYDQYDARWNSAWGVVQQGSFIPAQGAAVAANATLTTPLTIATNTGRRYRFNFFARAVGVSANAGYAVTLTNPQQTPVVACRVDEGTSHIQRLAASQARSACGRRVGLRRNKVLADFDLGAVAQPVRRHGVNARIQAEVGAHAIVGQLLTSVGANADEVGGTRISRCAGTRAKPAGICQRWAVTHEAAAAAHAEFGPDRAIKPHHHGTWRRIGHRAG